MIHYDTDISEMWNTLKFISKSSHFNLYHILQNDNKVDDPIFKAFADNKSNMANIVPKTFPFG